jgi:hypothetical protein
MLASPFSFFRGGPAIMANDLAGTPTSGITVQACGDAHLVNFGLFGSPERELVFSLNDFDETLAGPWEWEVLRLAASMAVAARQDACSHRHQKDAARTTVRAYREAMLGFAELPTLELWYLHLSSTQLLGMADRLEAEFGLRAEAGPGSAGTGLRQGPGPQQPGRPGQADRGRQHPDPPGQPATVAGPGP